MSCTWAVYVVLLSGFTHGMQRLLHNGSRICCRTGRREEALRILLSCKAAARLAPPSHCQNLTNAHNVSSDDSNDQLQPVQEGAAGGDGSASWSPGQSQLRAAGEDRQHLCSWQSVEDLLVWLSENEIFGVASCYHALHLATNSDN